MIPMNSYLLLGLTQIFAIFTPLVINHAYITWLRGRWNGGWGVVGSPNEQLEVADLPTPGLKARFHVSDITLPRGSFQRFRDPAMTNFYG